MWCCCGWFIILCVVITCVQQLTHLATHEDIDVQLNTHQDKSNINYVTQSTWHRLTSGIYTPSIR